MKGEQIDEWRTGIVGSNKIPSDKKLLKPMGVQCNLDLVGPLNATQFCFCIFFFWKILLS